MISEKCFEFLDAPVIRVGSMDTAVPFAGDLEKHFLGNNKLEGKCLSFLSTKYGVEF